jgi:DoxX-like protein
VFLLFDSIIKLMVIPPVIYLTHRTAIIGAILLTGYLGGAIATHVRIGSPLFSHVLFPIYVAVLLWGGLYLRDERVRTLLTPRRQS